MAPSSSTPPAPNNAAAASKAKIPAGGTPPKTKEPSQLSRLLNSEHIPFKEREYFAENLSLLLKSAVPIGDSLESLGSTVKSKAMKHALQKMLTEVEAGYSLADALEHAHVVSSQTLALVRLGEDSGHLVENMQLAAQQEEKRHIFRAKVRSALIYPVFVLSVTLIVGLGIAWFLLPHLSTTFSQLHAKLPFISRLMINFGVLLKAHGLLIVPLLLAVVLVLVYVFFVNPKTKHIGQAFLFTVPGVGRLMQEVEIAQFGYLLGTLLDAGLPITESLNLLAAATSSQRYHALYTYLSASLDDGYTFKESLSRYKNAPKLLPGAVQQMVIAGEHSGSLSEVLITIGRTYEQKSDITTENLETIMEPVLLVLVAGGVLLVAISVLLPIYGLLGGLNK